jgi:hypothetical protein
VTFGETMTPRLRVGTFGKMIAPRLRVVMAGLLILAAGLVSRVAGSSGGDSPEAPGAYAAPWRSTPTTSSWWIW